LAALHALHSPLHALSQHTPSTQKPLVHSPPLTQLEPLPSFGTHTEPEQ
jgi:hypothetical protein